MTDSTSYQPDSHGTTAGAPALTQLAEAAGGAVEVSEPQAEWTVIVQVDPGQALHLNFDPAAAHGAIKDGNLELTFANSGVVVIKGYEAWAAQGGQATGPQGGAVDLAQLSGPGEAVSEAAAPAVCEIPGQKVVDIPVPAAGERVVVEAHPGEALRLACEFKDVKGSEIGHNLELTFPDGGVAVIENFDQWVLAKGATITDCKCGGMNLADFIVALGMSPEEVLPAAGGPAGGPLGAANHPTFAVTPGQELLSGLEHPHILPPTALSYGVPQPEFGFLPVEENLGQPSAHNDGPGTNNDVGCITESGLVSGGEGGGEGGVGTTTGLGIQFPTDGAALKSTVTVDAGAVLTFQFNFLDAESSGQTTFLDFAVLTIDGQAFKLADVISAGNPLGTGGFSEQSGYLTFTFTFAAGGTHDIGFAVLNEGDTAVDSALLVDNITLTGGTVAGGNGSFESGLGGWTTLGNVAATGAVAGIVPPDGSHQAELVAEGAPVGSIETFLGLDSGTLQHVISGTQISGNVLDNDSFGPDGPGGIVDIVYSGNPANVVDPHGTTVGDITTFLASDGSWTLEFDRATGAYTFTLLAPYHHDGAGADEALEHFTYKIVDATGDTSSATLSICIEDDVPTVAANPGVQLDDDALAGGIPNGIGDDPDSVNVAGTLAHIYGADGAGTTLLTAAGAPAGFTYTLSPDGTVLTISQNSTGLDVLQVSLNDTTGGDYTVTQLHAIDHPAGQNENNVQFNVTYQVTDGDGDKANGTLGINVDDDTPTVSENALVQLDDDALAGGIPGGTGDDPDSVNTTGTLGHAYGADGAGTTLLSLTGTVLPDGFSAAVSNNGQTLTISQSGTAVLQVQLSSTTGGGYTVTQLHAIDHPAGLDENNLQFTVGYAVTDHDGDTAAGTLAINVDDDTPTVSENLTVQLDDDALAGGNPGGTGDDPNAANVTGTLAHSYGADQPGTTLLTVAGTVLPAGFTAAVTNGGQTLTISQGATAVLQVQLNNTTGGGYTVTQLHAIDHPAGLDENNLQFTVGYAVTDHDGDTAAGTLAINVDDDTPTVSENALVQLDDDALAGGNPGGTGDDPNAVNVTGTLAHSYGADQPGTTLLTVAGTILPAGFTAAVTNGGQTLTISQGATAVLQVQLTNTTGGAYTVTQLHAIDHPAGLDENNLQFTVGYAVTDHDGDTAAGTLAINVDDDTPTVSTNALVQLDDDALAGGNPGGTGDDPNAVNVTGTLAHSYGADGAGTTLLTVAGTILPAGFTAAVTDGGQTLTISQGATAVLQVHLTDTTSGAYTATQLHAIDHPAGQDENNLDFTVGYAVTDHDGDTAAGTLAINVDDDTPTVSANALVQLDDDALANGIPGGIGDDPNAVNTTGVLAHSYGADGAGTTLLSVTGTVLPAGFTAVVSDGGQTMTISQGATAVLQVHLSDITSGNYTVTQLHAIDHPDGQNENNLSFTVGYQVTDHDGDAINGTLGINVDDDTPVATDDTVSVDQKPTINLVIVFDRSGSMDENPDVPGFSTRIDLERAAIASLLSAYGSTANLNIMVVDFASDANNSGWLTGANSIQEANAYLDHLEAAGNTNYNAAINEVKSAYGPAPTADQQFVYFLSDGKPDPASSSLDGTANGDSPSNGLPNNLPATDSWEQFLINNGFTKSFAVGIGPDVSGANVDLGEIAFPDNDPNNPIIISSGEDAIFDALIATIVPIIAGNVITGTGNDQFGADGPGTPEVTQFVHHGVTYTPASPVGGDVISNDGHTIVIATFLGGEFTMNFDTGAYQYQPPASDDGGTEQFTYTIQDADHDTSSAVLTIDLANIVVEEPNRVFGTDGDDSNLIGTDPAPGHNGSDIIAGGDGSDTLDGKGGTDFLVGGAGADSIAGGDGNDVIVGGTTSENDGSDVIRAADTNDTLDGGAGNDLINGGDGADVIHGGSGDDEIVGGPTAAQDGSTGAPDLGDLLFGDDGNDTISGGAGLDTIVGGHGNDTIDAIGGNKVIQYTSVLDGHDVVNNFDGNSSGGQDVLDLDQLFDSMGVATGDRVGKVQIVDHGATVDVNIDTDNNTANGFELHAVTLNTSDTVDTTADVIVGTGP